MLKRSCEMFEYNEKLQKMINLKNRYDDYIV